MAPYMSFMSRNNGVVTNLENELLFESEDSLLYENDGGVGGLNHTPHLVKPLVFFTCITCFGIQCHFHGEP